MSRSIVSHKVVLAIVVLCSASMMRADNDSNNFAEQVKEKAKRGIEWSKEKYKAAGEGVKSSLDAFSQECKETWQNGKQKGSAFMNNARQLADERFGTNFSKNDDLIKHGRTAGKQPTDAELAPLGELKAPSEAEVDSKVEVTLLEVTSAPAEPIVENNNGVPANFTQATSVGKPTDVEVGLANDQSWIQWLQTPEGKKYGIGAIGVITVLGVTYVLYKNRVPQRVYGYVAVHPVKSAITTACVLGIAAFVAHQRGVTLESVKSIFTEPNPAQ